MMRNALLMGMLVIALASSAGTARAGAIPNQHIKQHLRVDGSSDLRGVVTARSGLRVTNGMTTDTIRTTGPVQVGGTLSSGGLATLSGGVSAGQSPITTGGALQGGTLTVASDAAVNGGLTVSKGFTAAAISDAGSLHVAGALDAASATLGGSLSAASIVDSGSLTAGTGTFTHLAVSPGGTVNFNDAQLTGVSGLTLSGAANLSSLQVTTSASGGAGGTQALSISQAGKTSSLSVSAAGMLTVAGAGLDTPTLSVANGASIGGTLSVASIGSSTGLALNAPNITTSNALTVGPAGSLHLDTNGGGSTAHILGNHDTRGECTVTATAGEVNQCSVTFQNAYPAIPVVVVTPTLANPRAITYYSVQASAGGFVISFTATAGGTMTFNYIVEG